MTINDAEDFRRSLFNIDTTTATMYEVWFKELFLTLLKKAILFIFPSLYICNIFMRIGTAK